jgi:hypothetical protein
MSKSKGIPRDFLLFAPFSWKPQNPSAKLFDLFQK